MFLKGFREFINESTNGATYADLKLLLELGMVDDIQDDMYRGFNQGSITHDELLDWITPICDKYKIKNWTLNKEGLVDVDGSVNLDDIGLTRLPLRFGKVTDDFWCSFNRLTTLEGAPREVGGDFWCYDNYLTTLEGAPQEVGGGFYCHSNYLTTLEGAPKEVSRNFYCGDNPLTSLEGIGEVGGKIYSDIK